MGEASSEKLSGAEKLLVGALLAGGAVAVAAMVLHERAIWFSPRVALLAYHVLWTLLWAPGLSLTIAVLIRRARVALLVGAALQVAAVVVYWASAEWLALAGALGFLGLGLPFIVRPIGDTRWHKVVCLAFLLGLPTVSYFDPSLSWPGDAFLVAALWVPYASTVWPSIGSAVDKALRQEAELRERSAAYRWLDWIGVAGLAVVALALLAAVIALAFFR